VHLAVQSYEKRSSLKVQFMAFWDFATGAENMEETETCDKCVRAADADGMVYECKVNK